MDPQVDIFPRVITYILELLHDDQAWNDEV